MSKDDPWDDDRRDDARDGDTIWDDDSPSGYPQPPKPGMSTGVKVLLIILCAGGLMLLLCCGGGVWFVSQMDFQVQDEPEAARKAAAEIAEIDIPEEFQPTAAMRFNFLIMKMNMAIYELPDESGGLVIAEMNIPFANDAETEEQFRQQIRQQGFDDEELVNQKTEIREFEIRGETVEFTFVEGEVDDGNKRRMVVGGFPGKDGMAFLMLQVDEDDYDEEKIVRMIESIR